ncbi:MAG: c-type cytochrome [Betaproteobacteria bacterium]|nr:c-type cytochrome [Betaproteobacteria bacterium]
MRKQLSVLLLSLLSIGVAYAVPPQQPKAAGIESPNYVWNADAGEKIEILKLKGNAERGKEAYQGCQGCHKPNGAGLPDGAYPQLAGQHASVLIKQMADMREGRRDNPKMFPFAGKHVVNTQEIADIAVYLQGMKIPHDNGKGPGTSLARGKDLYLKDCQTCHGENGGGNEKKFYPVLAGQHFKYMLRQIRDIRDGKRRNANPKMVKAVQGYSDAEAEAVVDYMSRLSMPERAAPKP